jgi:hypothetical protein
MEMSFGDARDRECGGEWAKVSFGDDRDRECAEMSFGDDWEERHAAALEVRATPLPRARRPHTWSYLVIGTHPHATRAQVAIQSTERQLHAASLGRGEQPPRAIALKLAGERGALSAFNEFKSRKAAIAAEITEITQLGEMTRGSRRACPCQRGQRGTAVTCISAVTAVCSSLLTALVLHGICALVYVLVHPVCLR